MKKRLLILPILAGFVLSSCSFEDLMFWKKKTEQETEQKEDEKVVTSVKINGSKSTLTIGEELKLTATVTASEGLSTAVDWSSSNSAVATVTAGGKVTAKAEGTVTITAKSQADSTKSDSVSITVVYNGLHPELLDEGFTYVKTFPAAQAKAFAGIDVAPFEAPEGFYFLNSPAVAPTETEEGSAATFMVVFEPTDDNFDAIEAAYAQYCYFYDSRYECDCYIDPTQKVEVDFGVVELEDENATELGMMNIYYVTDMWKSSTDTTDSEWEEETAAALSAFPVELPFVKLGESYDVYVYSDGSVEISDYCADFTKLDGYDEVLKAAEFKEVIDEDGNYSYVKANGEFTNAVVTFSFSMYGNTIKVARGLREVDYFPAVPLAKYVSETIGSKYSVLDFTVENAKYTFEITNEEGEEEGEVGEEYVSINVSNVAEGDCLAYIGSLVQDNFVIDQSQSFEHVMGQSVAYLQKGKIIIIATINYDFRMATEAEVSAYETYLSSLTDDDYAALSEAEQMEISINSFYIQFAGTYPVYLYDEAILGANLLIYGDENGLEDPGLYIMDSSIKLNPEGTYTIEPVFFEIDQATVTYTSSDSEVATVDENGVVTAVGLGTATITASIAETEYSDTLEVSVVEEVSIAPHIALANAWLESLGLDEVVDLPNVPGATEITSEYDSDYKCYSLSIYADEPEQALEDYIKLLTQNEYEIEDATDEGYGYYVIFSESVSAQIIYVTGDFFYIDFYADVSIIGESSVNFSEAGFENTEVVEKVELGNGTLIEFNKGSASVAATYYENGEALRVYAKSAITITAPTGEMLQSVTLVYTGSNSITASSGTISNGVWTAPSGGASSVTFTIGGTSGHLKVSEISVVLA